MTKPIDSGYRINSIALFNSTFRRARVIQKNESEPEVQIDVDIQNNDDFTILNVMERIQFVQNNEKGIEELYFDVTMVGIFEKVGHPSVDIDSFGKQHAAAMIFPFIREHIMSLSVKAHLNPIILPPFNFAEMYRQQLKE